MKKIEKIINKLIKASKEARDSDEKELIIQELLGLYDYPESEEEVLTNCIIKNIYDYLKYDFKPMIEAAEKLKRALENADFRSHEERVEQGESEANIKKLQHKDKEISDLARKAGFLPRK